MSDERSPEDDPAASSTEQVNPRTRDLDRLATGDLLERIVSEDATVASAVRAALPQMEPACDVLQRTLAAGGRWFNLGAGTSGRIGALDAAEIPPTFGLDPGGVQAVIAGGERALLHAVEGAEDDPQQAARDLVARGFAAQDALVVLSASGRTPYALGGLAHARRLGAVTIAITCAAESELARQAQLPIVVTVGPEVIAGSTRMKGGLAQKMVLHTLSTAVMVRLGRVSGNLMTSIRAVNSKLQLRAVGILIQLAGCSRDEAERALSAAHGSLHEALRSLGTSWGQS